VRCDQIGVPVAQLHGWVCIQPGLLGQSYKECTRIIDMCE
jgi:hypothetical protein